MNFSVGFAGGRCWNYYNTSARIMHDKQSPRLFTRALRILFCNSHAFFPAISCAAGPECSALIRRCGGFTGNSGCCRAPVSAPVRFGAAHRAAAHMRETLFLRDGNSLSRICEQSDVVLFLRVFQRRTPGRMNFKSVFLMMRGVPVDIIVFHVQTFLHPPGCQI